MKPLFILIASILVNPAMAQFTVSGTIKDSETGDPLIGATVYFPDLHKGTTCDINGRFSIGQVPKGSFNAAFGFIGYTTKVLHLHIAADTVIHIALAPDLKEMREVIVTGLSQATELKLSPMPAMLTNRQHLFRVPGTNLIDAISSQPGIAQMTTGPAIAKPVIRGLGSSRVLTLYNGLRQEGQQWGDEHGIEVDEFSIDKVEIIKGPGSIAYGSDAMAGVINFLPPHATEEGTVSGRIDAGFQTNNNQYHLSGATAGNIKGINWRLRVTGKQAGNYQNRYDGKVYNSGFNELDWSAQVGLNKQWGFSHVYASKFNQQLGLVEGQRDAYGNFVKPIIGTDGQPTTATVLPSDLKGYTIGIPYQRVRHFRLGTSNTLFFDKSSLMIKADYQRSQREEFGDIVNPEVQELYFKLNTFNYNIKYSFPETGHWQTATGINGMHQTNTNLGAEALIPDYALFDFGLYLLTQKNFAKFMLSGGLRFDTRQLNAYPLVMNNNNQPQTKFAAFTKNFYNLSASAGISYRPAKGWNLKLNISRGFRAPTLAELSSNGVHEGSFRYEYGNLNLQPETSLQGDLGIDLETKHTTLQIAAFYNHISNYTYLHKLQNAQGADSIPHPESGAIAYQYVQNTANLFGGEAGLDIHPHPFHWLHFENSFSFVMARQTNQPDSMRYLPFIPAPKFKSELRVNFANNHQVFTANYIKVEWEYYFAQNRIFAAYNTETVTPAYGLFGAAIGTTIRNKTGITIMQVAILAGNLLDKAYQSHLNRLKYAPDNPLTGRAGVFNMGRNISCKITVPLMFKEGGPSG